MVRRLLKYAVGVLVAWIAILLVLGFALNGRTRDNVAERIGESLGAKASIDDSNLALVRGGLTLETLSVRRDDTVGKLALDVREMECDLPPLGWAMFDRECGLLRVSGVKLEVSTFALFKIVKPKRKPLRAREVIIDDATFVFLPSSMIPSLGRTQIKIERAVAGPTTFKTPLSWLFALRELRAAIDVPPGVTVRLEYANGVLTASGSLLGSAPIALPVKLPIADLADDGPAELKKLVGLGKQLAEELVVQRAKDWVDSKL
jgi:hypothetical protein